MTRPDLSPALTGTELRRWYWLKDELADFARALGVRTTGGKQVLTARIAAHLDGIDFSEPAAARRASGRQLSGLLTAETTIPPGQRCSQHVRAWLSDQVGAAFRFDEPMRAFFASADGSTTLADAVAHWHATRDLGPREIGEQFEYNRFTRAWHEANPDGDRTALLAAWHEHRRRPRTP
ncbi:hypothetical protein SAMN04488550_1749 [Gordonia malaquae]|uniref:DUF6434 domain-containing protein n=1 Tax=Gordonia malaquae NBRC 108250 TaxID=1223542 RepID=M3UWT3_GORML|nr:DUF6434 domain-containing protein [Gordonia malaquae]GAC80122.1 hypothetical protein GM1_014_01150 [Gordonia malaquae NBRC 108250]SEC39141.1 hypothetical protein SAMN04488550_1749 [Gordonia malaquae]